MIDIQLLSTELNIQHCIDFASADAAGAVNVFIGTVRDSTKGKRVVRLEFEAYEPMALSEMEKIARRAIEKYQVLKVAIHHRVGALQIGETPVVIAVSAPHREASFEACQFVIDMLKETVPIWKKEIFGDGEVWVAAHP
ncbi:MAG: molybdenum cofactor biosynthesis protein MoaE [Saprospiraceae bacterium]